MQTKQNIRELIPNIGTGGPLSPITQSVGNGLIQLGVDKNLVNNLVRAPDSSQTQDALAAQLKSYGSDPEATAALKAYGTSGFSAAAVRAMLRHADREADSKIAAFNVGNDAFYKDPVNANVPKVATGAQGESLTGSSATAYRSHPVGLPKGTPYKVLGDRTVYYAK
jgi:hypothetical protein